jgi:preprotein translocase subunit YajC
MSSFFSVFAMAAPQGQDSGQSPFGFLGMILLFFAVMYVMSIRPQQRKEKERKAMLAELKKGDRVLFAGGLIGEIAQISDKTAKIKVADNVRMEVARGAITAKIDTESDLEEPPAA